MNVPFTPPPGFVSDDSKFLATGSWRNGSLVRFHENTWQVRGGWEKLMLNVLAGVCRAIFSWTDGAQLTNVAFGTHASLEVWQPGAYANITPAAFVAGSIDGTGGTGYGTGAYGTLTYGQPSSAANFPLTWSMGAFGSWLIANPRGQGVFVWKNVLATPAIPLAGAPAQVAFVLCVPQRQVMCFGCNEEVSGVYNPRAIRWSDIENIEGAPAWTTSPSNNAGEYILEGGGRIVSARRVGDYVFVWTDVALYLGTFVGAPDQTWKFEMVGEVCGSISPGAPVIRGQTALWISPDQQFWSCQLGGAPAIIDCPIRTDFVDHLSQGQNDKIIGATIATFREVCWLYPDSRDGFETSREITLGVNGWFRGQLARTAASDALPTAYPIKTDAAGHAYWHEKGNSADGAPMTGFIESNDFYLGEAEGGLMINGCWPDLKDQIGTVALTVYARENPQAPERTKGPWSLTPGQSRRSFRLSGRLARVRFDFNSAPARARGGKFEFDTQAIGGR